MSSTFGAFNEALQRASNPTNPPPARPLTLEESDPASSLDPSLVKHWHNNSQLTPPNTALESGQILWHPPDSQLNGAQAYSFGGTWNHVRSQSFPEARADLHLQAIACEENSQMHECDEYLSPPGAIDSLAGESSHEKGSTVGDFSSEADKNETPNFEDSAQDDNIFEMSDLQQQAQPSMQEYYTSPFQMISGTSQEPNHATLTDIHQSADSGTHPSPTESQLISEGFEFHNRLPEEVQINRFNDKAFRKALREVQSDLPRKQQWYAWSKAKQMLNGELESAATGQMDNSWGEPLKLQHQIQHKYQHEDEVSHTNITAAKESQVGRESESARPLSPDTTTHGANGTEDEKEHAMERQSTAQVPRSNTPSSPASTGGFAIGHSNWHAPHEAHNNGDRTSNPERINQDRLSAYPLVKLISQVAEKHRARRQSINEGLADKIQEPSTVWYVEEPQEKHDDSVAAMVTARKMAETHAIQSELQQSKDEVLTKTKELEASILACSGGNAPSLLPHSYYFSIDKEDRSIREEDHVGNVRHPCEAPTSCPRSSKQRNPTAAPPLPPPPSVEQSSNHLSSSTTVHNADLFRPHTNTILRRSPPSFRSHLPTPVSPNRRSPSPWIEHPGINRPDTPRPSHPSSPLHSDIRQSVEPETLYSSRTKERESTPAYSNRSPSPSPVSELTYHNAIAKQQKTSGPSTRTQTNTVNVYSTTAHQPQIDTEMTDAPSSPSVVKIPTQHIPQHSSPDPLSSPIIHGGNTFTAPTTPLRPPPIPPNREFNTSTLESAKTRRKSIGGQTTSISRPKSRNVTAVQGGNVTKARRVTQVAQKVKETKVQGVKVAQAVRKIEEGIRAVDGSLRRSARLAVKKGGR